MHLQRYSAQANSIGEAYVVQKITHCIATALVTDIVVSPFYAGTETFANVALGAWATETECDNSNSTSLNTGTHIL